MMCEAHAISRQRSAVSQGIRVLLRLTVLVLLIGASARSLQRRLGRIEYRLAVIEGRIAALENDDSDVALVGLPPATRRDLTPCPPSPLGNGQRNLGAPLLKGEGTGESF
jgi:hypothetical protein